MQKRIDEASFFWEGDISPYLTSVSGVFSPKEIPFLKLKSYLVVVTNLKIRKNLDNFINVV
jgi:hypothetical protein